MDSRLNVRDRPSGLDISLLGLIAAIIGGYGRSVSFTGGGSPDLIRFFAASPDRTYAAVMPQDKALLLLNDPSLDRSTQAATEAAVSLDGLWTLVAIAGVILIAAGPVIAWANYTDD